ncbi:MAG: hypothetical protein ACR2LX_04545 [Jatrophihabitans sp.]
MRTAADAVLPKLGGVASRDELLTRLTPAQLDDEIRRGRLTRVFRRAYCRPWDLDLPATIDHAALISVGAPAVLSHLTSLRQCGLDVPGEGIHVSIPASRLSRPQDGLTVHRVETLPHALRLDGLMTAAVAPSVVSSWPLLAGPDQRGPAIAAG